MGTWLFHLGLASAGLGGTAMVAALMLRVWCGRPVASYRLAVIVLASALALPLAQLAIEAGDVSTLGLARGTWSRWTGPSSPSAAEVSGAVRGVPPRPAGPSTVPATRERPAPAATAAPLPPFLQVLLATSRDLRDTRQGEASPVVARATPWLLALYLAGAAWAVARLAARLANTRRLLRDARPVEDAATLALWDRVAAGSRLRRVRLLRSEGLRAPACFGLRVPALVLPARDRMSDRPDVQRCVLLHELLHLERRDTWVLLLQEVFRCAFWFHPASAWLVGRLDALREISCDHLAAVRSGGPRRYATALVEYAAALGERPRAATGDPAMLAWSSSQPQLKKRIDMLLSKKSSGRTVCIPLAAGLLAVSWSCQLALAGTMPEPGDETAPEPAAAVVPPEPATAPEPLAVPAPPAAIAGAGEVALGLRLRQVHDLLVVSEVLDGSPAERAGVRAGDVILAVDGHRAVTMSALQAGRERLGAGRDVALTVLRDGRAQTLTLTRGARQRTNLPEAVDEARARDAYREALEHYRPVDPDAQGADYRALYEAGRKYYQGTDSEQFQEQVEQAIAQYREAMGDDAGHSRYAELLARVQEDPERYYEAGARYFREHTADDLARALHDSQAAIEDSKDGQAALRLQLLDAQRRIEQQAAEIAELRKAIEDLRRAQGKPARTGSTL